MKSINELGQSVSNDSLNAQPTITNGLPAGSCALDRKDQTPQSADGETAACLNGVCQVTWKPTRHAA